MYRYIYSQILAANASIHNLETDQFLPMENNGTPAWRDLIEWLKLGNEIQADPSAPAGAGPIVTAT